MKCHLIRATWRCLTAGAIVFGAGSARADLTVSINAPTVGPGETALAAVTVESAIGFAGADLVITFPDYIAAGAARTTPATADYLVASRASAGRIQVALARAEGLGESSATILHVPLRVAKSAPIGSAALSLDQVRFYDAQPVIMRAQALAGGIQVSPPAPDLDGDGVPDSWETRYFGGISGTAVQDSDRDGVTDQQEFLAGTDPTEAESVFRIVETRPVDQGGSRGVLVQWQGLAEKNYTIEWSPGITRQGMFWHPVYNPDIRKDGDVFSWTDDGTRTHGQADTARGRYYRIVVLPD